MQSNYRPRDSVREEGIFSWLESEICGRALNFQVVVLERTQRSCKTQTLNFFTASCSKESQNDF